jgi:hypothetical protein
MSARLLPIRGAGPESLLRLRYFGLGPMLIFFDDPVRRRIDVQRVHQGDLWRAVQAGPGEDQELSD